LDDDHGSPAKSRFDEGGKVYFERFRGDSEGTCLLDAGVALDTPAATGHTNANGEFSIRSMIGPGYDGALPGEYWISLSAPRQAPADANGSKPTAIPQKYRNPRTAKIPVSVNEQTNDLGTIRLQS